MSGSTEHLPTIAQSQAQKETTQNAINAALSPAAVFGRDPRTSAALTWGYLGGVVLLGGLPVILPNGTVALAASNTNYIYAAPLGSPLAWSVVVTTSLPSGWPGPPVSGAIALYSAVTGAASVTSWLDYRVAGGTPGATGATGAAGSAAPRVIQVAVSDETTAITAGTAKLTFRMPYAMTVSGVRASINVASSSGAPTVDINESGTTILSTKLSIDVSELTSVTAATPAVISDAALADDAEITIDIDSAGTGAKGLKVTLIGS